MSHTPRLNATYRVTNYVDLSLLNHYRNQLL